MTPNFSRMFELVMEAQMNSLSTNDIYNFYFLTTLLQTGRLDSSYKIAVATKKFRQLREKYLNVFGELVHDQILKYIKRGRVDPEVTGEVLQQHRRDFPMLHELMQKTYRSDMKRRNDVWNRVSEYLAGLYSADNVKQISYFIDRINQSVHNTQELLFSKFVNARELMFAFDKSHEMAKPEQFQKRVSPEIADLLLDI